MKLRSVVFVVVVGALGCGASSPPVQTTEVEETSSHVTPDDATAAMLGLGASVDPARGVLVLARVEDPSDGEGRPPPTSGLRCGAEVDELAAALSDYASDRRGMMGTPLDWVCAQDRCELRGMMEFDPTRVLHFARDLERGLVVTGVDLFDEPMDGAALRTELDAEQARARAGCP